MLSKKFKVVIFLSEFLPASQTFISNYVKNLQTFCEVLVVCSKNTLNSQGFTIIEIPNPNAKRLKSLRSYRNYYYSSSYYKALNEVLFVFKPDFIHCHFGDNLPRLIYNIDSKYKSKIMCHYWGFDASSVFSDSYYKRLINRIYNDYNILSIFVSKALKNSFIKNVRAEQSCLHVAHHGINPDLFYREDRGEKQKKIYLQVSRLVEKKGIAFSIQAFESMLSRVKRRDLELHIVGQGPLYKSLQKQISNCKHPNQIKLLGNVEHEKIRNVYESASYFIHHSITATNGDMEGLPTSIMEAMAMELPVVVSNHSGIEELVKDGVNGYIVEEKNISQYVEKLILINSWQYKEENAAKVRSKFNVHKYPKELISFAANQLIS